ncbi:hypothetical protein DFA_05164 [Cavenderia fasciculata]|uniref:Uncharacterized protein n=1 Tax=Cavenderia fasciculata TaxID=261658 RepID=F4PNI1_CACFS|nr:uncharacterized protein DFA_05164 [Cavenderia fasciculata]EGG23034.1 hypothetical protein DFA_05164 [Cavenderia fasciculata]|eukprot:XP_004360885.1 hypothetical protein DFA_05164 [Cavenderia fasciculata]
MRFLLALIVFVCLAFQSAYAQLGAEFFLYMPNAKFLSNAPIANDNGAYAQEVCSQVGARRANFNEFAAQVGDQFPNLYEWKYYGYLYDDSSSTGNYLLARPMDNDLQTVSFSTPAQSVGFLCFGYKPPQGFLGIPKRNRCYWNIHYIANGHMLNETFSVKANGDTTVPVDLCNNNHGAVLATDSQVTADFYAGAAICAFNVFESDNDPTVQMLGYYYNKNNLPGQCNFGFTKGLKPDGYFDVLCHGCKPVDNVLSAAPNTIVSFNDFTGQYSRYENMPLYTPQT